MVYQGAHGALWRKTTTKAPGPSVVAEPLAEPTQEDADGADKDDDLFFEVGAMELEKPADSEQPQA